MISSISVSLVRLVSSSPYVIAELMRTATGNLIGQLLPGCRPAIDSSVTADIVEMLPEL